MKPIYIDYRRLFAELEAGIGGPCTLALLAGEDSPPPPESDTKQ
jgi:hypothetical protein